MKKILIINAALNGKLGSTEKLLQMAAKKLQEKFEVNTIYLTGNQDYNKSRENIFKADGFIIGTGVHWSNWSSLFQKFIEDATLEEKSDMWLGKPCAFIVTSHSHGDSEVLSKLVTTMNLFGCYTPPLCLMGYSMAEHNALKLETNKKSEYWSPEDLDVICHNFGEAVMGTRNWKFWENYPPENSLTEAWLK